MKRDGEIERVEYVSVMYPLVTVPDHAPVPVSVSPSPLAPSQRFLRRLQMTDGEDISGQHTLLHVSRFTGQ